MEKLSDIPTSQTNRSVPFSVGLMTVVSKFLWLIGFFRLTKEDRLAAGICADVEETQIEKS